MRASSVAVRTVPSQTCFVRLPPVLIRQLPPTTTACAFRLRWPAEAPNRTVYVSWGGEVSASDALEVPSALAEALGLRLPVRVALAAVELPRATSVAVQAETGADWEAIRADAAAVEEHALAQLAVVAAGQRLPLWLRRTVCVWLRVTALEPAVAAARLGPGTEIVVAPSPPSNRGAGGGGGDGGAGECARAPAGRSRRLRVQRERAFARRVLLEWRRLRRRERRLSLEDTLRERSEVLYRAAFEWLYLTQADG